MKSNAPVFLAALILLSACAAPGSDSSIEDLSTPAPQQDSNTNSGGALLIWESVESPCETAILTVENLSYGKCGDALTAASTQTTGHAPRLSDLWNRYASFTAQTPAGNLIFKGAGDLVPSDSETRAIAEWAKLMFQVAEAGRAGASWSLAFAWHREGGIAGFCDDVAVYLTGWATASDCKGFNAQTYLTASQLEQLFAWVDGLSNVDYNDSNAPLADGMTITLALAGSGQKKADKETIREIIAFAATLDAQLGFAASAGPEVGDAEKSLREYLAALNGGDYVLAAKLYGGDTSLMQTWNPDIENDLPALFERACTQNGLQCLAPRTITYRASEVDGHHFWVEFSNADGALFQQGPCCGETNGITTSMFPFSVEQTANVFTVMDLPPYVP